jgi:transcriptional regulator with PAS, ATPase and Fis domain
MSKRNKPGQEFEDLSYHEAMEQYSQLAIAEALQMAAGDEKNAAQILKLQKPRPGDERASYHDLMDRHGRLLILQALWKANGSLTKAAEKLRLSKTYLARLIKQQNTSIPHAEGSEG